MTTITSGNSFPPSATTVRRSHVSTARHLRAAPAAAPSSPSLGPADPTLTLSVVVPFYNPGSALLPATLRLLSALEGSGMSWEVIAVSDGSTDGSERTITGLHPQLHVDVAPVNRGKGAALRRGFTRARGQWIAYVDADGDIDGQHVVSYAWAGMAGDHPVVYADKRHALSLNLSTPYRRALSRAYSGVVKALFALEPGDTQTGCKVIRRDVLRDVLPQLREDGFALDLELFVALSRHGHHGSLSMPVTLNSRLAGSTIGPRALLRTAKDTMRVLGRARLMQGYGPARVPQPTALPAPVAHRAKAVA